MDKRSLIQEMLTFLRAYLTWLWWGAVRVWLQKRWVKPSGGLHESCNICVWWRWHLAHHHWLWPLLGLDIWMLETMSPVSSHSSQLRCLRGLSSLLLTMVSSVLPLLGYDLSLADYYLLRFLELNLWRTVSAATCPFWEQVLWSWCLRRLRLRT